MRPPPFSTSIPISTCSRWTLRVLTGTSAGREFPLLQGGVVVGSAPGVQIQIPLADVAPRHCELRVSSTSVSISSIGGILTVNGTVIGGGASLRGGDVIGFGSMQLQLVDQSLPVPAAPSAMSSWIRQRPVWIQFSAVLGVLSSLLIVLTLATGNARLVPITTLASAGVVPFAFLGFIYSRYGPGVCSLRSLLVTVALGATLGLVVTLLLGFVLPFSGGPMLAPLFEEPAKLLATVWCWHRAGYRSPLAGLVLGLAAGTGFAVAETAGYIFESTAEGGIAMGLVTLVLRSALAPFTHGIWTAAVASAWFQVGWGFNGPWQPIFLRALLIAMALHATWNSGPWYFLLCSAGVGLCLFIRLCKSRGTWGARWVPVP